MNVGFIEDFFVFTVKVPPFFFLYTLPRRIITSPQVKQLTNAEILHNGPKAQSERRLASAQEVTGSNQLLDFTRF